MLLGKSKRVQIGTSDKSKSPGILQKKKTMKQDSSGKLKEGRERSKGSMVRRESVMGSVMSTSGVKKKWWERKQKNIFIDYKADVVDNNIWEQKTGSHGNEFLDDECWRSYNVAVSK